MDIKEDEITEIIREMINLHPEYKVKRGEHFFEEGVDTYLFSSHHFIELYRARNQEPYAALLWRCRHSRISLDRDAHGQIAACLGRYARVHRHHLTKIGRIRDSWDVHGKMVRPMWWVFRRGI